MSTPPPESGFGFVGYENLHTDIYSAVSAQETSVLHQPGKVILVTGAGRGIGRAIALQYAYAGVASIILCARTMTQLDEVESNIRSINSHIRVHKQAVDVASEAAVAALVKEIATKETRLDVLVNNAGYSAPWVPLHEADPNKWWHTMEVNLKGPFLLTHAFLPLMLVTAEKTGYVHVINQSSIAAHLITPVASAYQISKLALCRFTEHLDAAYAEKGLIAISSHPGGVRTTMAEQEMEILEPFLTETPDLAGGFTVWLTAQPRTWISGRYASATWDVDILEAMKDEIESSDKLKAKLIV